LSCARRRFLLEGMTEVQHATVYFSGRVQGVGFRYQALQAAKGFEVAGFVQNLPDGRVQLEAEGAADEVRDFIEEVQARMEGHIRRTEQTGGMRAPRYAGFTIR
jgi:acylphosphatase